MVAGGIDAIFASAMTIALPLTVILVLMAWSLLRGLGEEAVPSGRSGSLRRRAAHKRESDEDAEQAGRAKG